MNELVYPGIRATCFFLENPTIGDGRFMPEIAATLRAYADMLDAEQAGHDPAEIWVSPGGTRVFRVGASWNGQCIPRPLGTHISELTT